VEFEKDALIQIKSRMVYLRLGRLVGRGEIGEVDHEHVLIVI
jgi:hypothetical protein